jgi:hypothetical protein
MAGNGTEPRLVNTYSPKAIADISDGCSGGLSWLHRKLFGREIACTYCCDEHDVAYFEGGTQEDRRRADQRLRLCVQQAGQFGGWRGPLRRAWRFALSWIMYAAVRLFGGRYWGQDDL